MVIQHHLPQPLIKENTLPARRINIPVRSIHQRPAVLSNTVSAFLVDEASCRGGGAADADAVFFAEGLELVGGVAAGAAAEEEVVVVGAVDDPAELVRAFDVFAGGVLGEVRVRSAFGDAQGRVGHGILEDVVVEGAEG